MAQLTGIIPQQSFELVRDRIGEILADELANQVTLQAADPDIDINATVWVERFIPFDNTELPAINVMMSRGQYSNVDRTQMDGSYEYFIDVYTNSVNTTEEGEVVYGDKTARLQLHRILGICRAIMANPRFSSLGFARPFNNRVIINNITVFDNQENRDALNSALARLSITVDVPEYVELVEPSLMNGYETQVKLYETEYGYKYGPEGL